jgi:hypothetical protein
MCRAGCLDGPRLAEFILDRPDAMQILSDADRRTVRRWACGQQARVGTADRILIELDCALGLLGEDFFKTYVNGRSGCRRGATA